NKRRSHGEKIRTEPKGRCGVMPCFARIKVSARMRALTFCAVVKRSIQFSVYVSFMRMRVGILSSSVNMPLYSHGDMMATKISKTQIPKRMPQKDCQNGDTDTSLPLYSHQDYFPGIVERYPLNQAESRGTLHVNRHMGKGIREISKK